MSRFLYCFALCLAPFASIRAQTINAAQQMLLEGVRSANGNGSFVAAAYAPDGTAFLLYNQRDGIRVLKTDAAAGSVLAQTQMGAAGDTPVAMAVDPSGDLYITGTTTSGTLAGTGGTAFPSVADSSTNSFLAKYDANLNLIFLTFLGAGRTAATGIAVTADSAFLTGVTYSTALPVTASGIQQRPAAGSTENGFVERISSTGQLVYATYLTGVDGNTTPAAIVADSSDNAYIAGATTASGFPTISALQPSILGATSGFLSSLAPGGNAFGFSTFIAGAGITSLALDSASSTLLLTGSVSLGQFPVATVAMPLASTNYQTLLRIPLSGNQVTDSVLLAPGSASYVIAGASESAWIAGSLSTPLFPGVVPPDYNAGDSFLLHITSSDVFDQTLRLGGLAKNNAGHASLTSNIAAPAVNSAGTTVLLPGTLTATVDASLLATQRFDLPLVNAPQSVLPNTLSDVLSFSCVNSSACAGTGGLLASVTVAGSAPSLGVSVNDLPNITLRNLGSATATGLSFSVSGYTLASDCGTTLAASGQCSIALTGSGPGVLTVSATGAATVTVPLAANTLLPDALALSTDELDFGIVSAVDGTAYRTISVTNLTNASQTFPSAIDNGATTAYVVNETASTCGAGSGGGTHSVAAGSSCTITLGLTPSNTSADDGPVRAAWKIGTRDVILTGFAQAAALNFSASEVDFGTQFAGATSLDLPRYLYISNNSGSEMAHTAAALPSSSPFTVADHCPSTLEPHSVCQIALRYASLAAPSYDAEVLNLDEGTTVLLTGETLPLTGITGAAANPSLSVSASSVTFTTPVAVTAVSATSQTLMVQNTGTSSMALTLAVSGDFTVTDACPATLAAGASCSLSIGFAPSQPGTRQGVLSLTAGSGFTPTYVSLSGTGSAILPANNGTLQLGTTYVGEPEVVWYQVQQPISSLTVTSSGAPFGVALVEDTGSGHGTLPASVFGPSATIACGSCWMGVQYLSNNAGTQSGQITLASSPGGNPYVLNVTGTALPVSGLLLSPIQQDFGTVAVNSASAPITLTLANLVASASPVTVQSITATGDFSVVSNSMGGATCAGSLGSTASCFVQIVFAPTATGDRSGTLTVVTTGGTASATLTGYGAPDPGLGINPVAVNFLNVPGSSATEQTVVLTNTGSVSLAIGAPSVSDASFATSTNCSTIAPGAACSIAVAFTPQTALTSGTLSIPVSSTVNGQLVSSTYNVALSGGYTTQTTGLELLPGAVNFGSTATSAQGATRTFTLNNLTGKTLAVALTMPRQFPLATPATCTTLAAFASCSFAVNFLPVTGGALTGTVVAQGIPSDGSATVEALGYMLGYGAGSGALTISGEPIPNQPVSFGQLASGQSTQQTLTLTNSGGGTLTIRRLSSTPPFYSTSTCGATLAAGASCAVTLTYAPIDEILASQSTAPRADSGTLTVESDAATSPDTVVLTGVAMPVVSSSPASSAVLDAFSLSQSAITFANTQVGDASAAQTVMLTNTGTATIHVLSVTAPADFNVSSNCAALLPGASCNLSVSFTPTNASTASVRSGTVEIASDASTSLEFISLLGTSAAAPITLSPATLNFGTVNVGLSDALAVTVTNTVGTPVSFTALGASGDYAVAAGTCPVVGGSLAAGSSCTLNVTFTPTATGSRTGTLSLATDATQLPLSVALAGNGVEGQLQVTPGALAFGSIDVGATATLTLTLLNTGTATLTNIGNALVGTNAAEFDVVAPCSSSSLAPNQGCTETVAFTPAATGTRTATLTVTSSDPHGPSTIALSGTGAVAGSFALTVNGGTSATLSVASGSPASFPLSLTPMNGYTGSVALTCTPVTAGEYASCSLLASSLTLNGAAQSSTATINTITSEVRAGAVAMACLLGGLLLPRRRRRYAVACMVMSGITLCLGISGCGGGTSGGKALLYTPAGTYQYTVTASSTSGTPVSSTVTLNVIVQ